MFNPKEFVLETITRLLSGSPKYFNYLKWISAIAVLLPWAGEAVLSWLDIAEPMWLVKINDGLVKVAGITAFLIAQLTKKDINDVPKNPI